LKENINKVYQQYLLRFGNALARNNVHMALVHRACQAGFYSYIGKPIDQKVIFISNEFSDARMRAEWEDVTSKVDVVNLPIDHETMFTEPEVEVLGKKLSQLIKAAS